MFEGAARGFSLIEVMIVITIIGIVATLAMPLFSSAMNAVNDSVVKSDLRNAFTSIDFYLVQNNRYPSNSADLASVGFSLSPGVSFTKFDLKENDGVESIHIHIKHVDSSNEWHADYPKEGTKIELR